MMNNKCNSSKSIVETVVIAVVATTLLVVMVIMHTKQMLLRYECQHTPCPEKTSLTILIVT